MNSYGHYDVHSLNKYRGKFSYTFNRNEKKKFNRNVVGVSLLNLAVFDSFPPLFDTRPSPALRECWVVYITGTRVRRVVMRGA